MKRFIFTISLLLIVSFAYGEEIINDFKDESLPVLNEELRLLREETKRLRPRRYDTFTILPDDTTPDVSGGKNFFITSANTGATAITDLDNSVVGQVIYIIGGSNTNSSTVGDSGNFALSGAWTAGLDDVLILYVQADNDYIELGQVDN